jgi:hypothetical protein
VALGNAYADPIDPRTGRIAEVGFGSPYSRLFVHEFRDDAWQPSDPIGGQIAVLGASWIDGGDLIALTSPGYLPAFGAPVELLRVAGDGSGTEAILAAERVDGATFAGTRPGFVLVSFWAREQMQLVLVRTSDGASGSIVLGQAELAELYLIDLVDG